MGSNSSEKTYAQRSAGGNAAFANNTCAVKSSEVKCTVPCFLEGPGGSINKYFIWVD